MGQRSHYENSSKLFQIHLYGIDTINYMGKPTTKNVDAKAYIIITFRSLPDSAVEMNYDVEASEAEVALAMGKLYEDLSTRSKIRMIEILQQYLDKETGFLEVREKAVEVKH